MKKILPKVAASFVLMFMFLCSVSVPYTVVAAPDGGKASASTPADGGKAPSNSNTPADGGKAADLTTGFQLDNPLSVSSLQELMEKVLNAVVLLLTPVIVIMLIYSGFLFVTSQTSENGLKKAKETFKYTLIGAAIIIGAKGLAMALANTISQF